MDFSHYRGAPVVLAVDLVNTFDAADGTEDLATVHDVEAFIADHGEGWDPPAVSIGERDLHEIRAVRSRLREVFDATDSDAAAEIINSLLADVGAVPRISLHGDAPHLHFESSNDRPPRWLGAIAAMGLSVALVEGGFERFGSCASATCDDVYVDTSRNRSRRNCSDTCTTRENVAAFRRRQRAED